MSNELLNESSKEKLTVAKLRTFEGFENISIDKASEIIKSLEALSSILYDSFQLNILNK